MAAFMASAHANFRAYVYFDNDQKSAAPKDAADLVQLLSGDSSGESASSRLPKLSHVHHLT
jgi:uncharacterized protein YecE (DUF72 family)